MASQGSTNAAYACIKGPNFLFIVDYFMSRDLPVGTCITSPTFTAGGYDWTLDFYPHGNMPDEFMSYVSLFLCLKSEAVKDITAKYYFRLLNKNGRFYTVDCHVNKFTSSSKSAGCEKFFERYLVEQEYCVDNTLAISCSIQVVTQTTYVQTYPGGLCEHMGKLWQKRERSDVTFDVEGENISAHRLILAARSPVFEAELYGSMAEAKLARIKIEEIKAEVFKALLHFIYTDQIANDDSGDDQTLSVELLHGLLVVPDRYALGRLSLLCEQQLARSFSVDTVAATLLLADRHICVTLKSKCLDFTSDPRNFSLVALTDGYLQIMQKAPTLFAELSDKVKCSMKNFAKKQRTF